MKKPQPAIWVPPTATRGNLPLVSTGNGSQVKWGSWPNSSVAAGSQGPQGYQGSSGSNGTNGTNGSTGAQGPQGYQGVPGTSGSGGTNIWHIQLSSGALGSSGVVNIGRINSPNGYSNYFVIATCVMIGRPYMNTACQAKLTLDAGSTGTFNGSSSILSTINIPFMDNGSGTSIIMNNECTVSSVLNVGSTSTYVDLYAYAQITTGSVFSAQQGILTVIGIN